MEFLDFQFLKTRSGSASYLDGCVADFEMVPCRDLFFVKVLWAIFF